MRATDQKHMEGLSSLEAQERLVKFGPNLIYTPTRISFWTTLRHEVTEPMILLLLVVGFFYSIWGRLEDAVTIFVVIFLLVLAEVQNEYRAKKAIAALEKIAAPRARVVRDGKVTEVETEHVVPGDMLILSPGTDIAADAEIERAIDLHVDESTMTGESFPQDKRKGDKIYAGTTVLAGEGRARVFATGRAAGIGKITATLKTVKHPKTPLQTAMKSLVSRLVFVALFFSVAIPVLGILRHQDVKTMILTGLSLSFATIPEELPIIITMVLGLGAYTLSKNNFLVKRLKAAETLGSATVIVADKTGTITEGKMKITSLYPSEKERELIERSLGSLSDYIFSPIESAIENMAEELNISTVLSETVRQRNLWGNGGKTKAVLRKAENGFCLYLSGAPEEVFAKCREISPDVHDELDRETTKGRRVIAVAYKILKPGRENLDFPDLERDMDFAGLIGFEDPPRHGVREAIALASAAGIRTIMVTGDHSLTAVFVAGEVGIPAYSVSTGSDIDRLTDEELKERVKSISVFARTTPDHKYRIVKALQENGEVVAVTGDGVNDVLALKGADIGIAMGIRGTDVAKDASEVVLADDNFITIAQGIFEGRKFFDNLQKGITYYLSVKVALIMIFLLPVLLGVPMPFSPIQIIILELFMDLAASAGFVAEPKEKDIYYRHPRNRKEKVLTSGLIKGIFANGTALFLAVMSVYLYARYRGLDLSRTQTYAFSAWIFGHVILAFVCRSTRESIITMGIFTNKIINTWAAAAIAFLAAGLYIPFLRVRFNLASIDATQLLLIGFVTLLIISSLELKKSFALLPGKDLAS